MGPGTAILDAVTLVGGRYEPVLTATSGTVRVDRPVPTSIDLDLLAP